MSREPAAFPLPPLWEGSRGGFVRGSPAAVSLGPPSVCGREPEPEPGFGTGCGRCEQPCGHSKGLSREGEGRDLSQVVIPQGTEERRGLGRAVASEDLGVSFYFSSRKEKKKTLFGIIIIIFFFFTQRGIFFFFF